MLCCWIGPVFPGRQGGRMRKATFFVVYPIAYLADDLGKSHMTVKKALNELEDAGLLERQKQGFSKPNLLYVRIPAEGKKSVPVKERKLSPKGKEKDTYEGKKPVPVRDRKVSPNNMSNSHMIYSQTNKEREARSAYGEISQCVSLRNRIWRIETGDPGNRQADRGTVQLYAFQWKAIC